MNRSEINKMKSKNHPMRKSGMLAYKLFHGAIKTKSLLEFFLITNLGKGLKNLISYSHITPFKNLVIGNPNISMALFALFWLQPPMLWDAAFSMDVEKLLSMKVRNTNQVP